MYLHPCSFNSYYGGSLRHKLFLNHFYSIIIPTATTVATGRNRLVEDAESIFQMSRESSPHQPSLPWRTGSSLIMGFSGAISRIFIFGANRTDIHGLDSFLGLLDERRDISERQRGLITGKSSVFVVVAV